VRSVSKENVLNIDYVKFDEKGLIPVIAQENTTGEILMFAWMNRESLEITLETGKMTYWSRSRQKLWLKGGTSGNFQEVVEAFIDCDCDTLLFKVEQKGLQAACHNGYKSCFYRRINPSDGSLAVIAEKVFEPEEVYGK
jgi:phosphoribosyl-AMP cyclohydrolase